MESKALEKMKAKRVLSSRGVIGRFGAYLQHPQTPATTFQRIGQLGSVIELNYRVRS